VVETLPPSPAPTAKPTLAPEIVATDPPPPPDAGEAFEESTAVRGALALAALLIVESLAGRS